MIFSVSLPNGEHARRFSAFSLQFVGLNGQRKFAAAAATIPAEKLFYGKFAKGLDNSVCGLYNIKVLDGIPRQHPS